MNLTDQQWLILLVTTIILYYLFSKHTEPFKIRYTGQSSPDDLFTNEELSQAANYRFYSPVNNIHGNYTLLKLPSDKFDRYGPEKYLSSDKKKSKVCVNTGLFAGPGCCNKSSNIFSTWNPLSNQNQNPCNRCVINCTGEYKDVLEWPFSNSYYLYRDVCFAACNPNSYLDKPETDEFRNVINRALKNVDPLTVDTVVQLFDLPNDQIGRENARRIMRSIGCQRIHAKGNEFWYWNNSYDRCMRGESLEIVPGTESEYVPQLTSDLELELRRELGIPSRQDNTIDNLYQSYSAG